MTNKGRTRRVILLDRGPRCACCRQDLGESGYAVGGWGVREEFWCADCVAPRAAEVRSRDGRTSRVERVEIAGREATDLPARERDAVLQMRRKGWALGLVDTDPVGTNITAAAEVDGHEVSYTLWPDNRRDTWGHHFEGLGLEFGVLHRALAPLVASPGAALRLLRETDEWHRSYLRALALPL